MDSSLKEIALAAIAWTGTVATAAVGSYFSGRARRHARIARLERLKTEAISMRPPAAIIVQGELSVDDVPPTPRDPSVARGRR